MNQNTIVMHQFETDRRYRGNNGEDPSTYAADEMMTDIPVEKLAAIVKNVFTSYMHNSIVVGRDEEPTICHRHFDDDRLQ